MILENNLLRKEFGGPDREEVATGLKKLHCEELHKFCSLHPNARQTKCMQNFDWKSLDEKAT
jgi:hypothetical protein